MFTLYCRVDLTSKLSYHYVHRHPELSASLLLILLPLCEKGAQPQEADGQEGQEVEQEIPAAEAGWGGFDVGGCFATSLRAVQFHADAPFFLHVEVHQSFVLKLFAQIFAFGAISCFG